MQKSENEVDFLEQNQQYKAYLNKKHMLMRITFYIKHEYQLNDYYQFYSEDNLLRKLSKI
jgi:hypothetical protein